MKAARPQKHSDKLNPKNEKTLRDEFAMAALTGWLGRKNADLDSDAIVAKECYDLADAMLEARK